MSNKGAPSTGDGDKRKVSTDALETLGTIITEHEKRDAIHLAVEPVLSKVRLKPGANVNAAGLPEKPYVGIVDPFIKGAYVEPGEWFWLVVYPRQIQSLRHVWTHPDFPDTESGVALEAWLDKAAGSKDRSERWLREYVSSPGYDGPDYHTLLAKAEEFLKYGATDEVYLHIDGQDAHGELNPEAWDHIGILLGIPVPENMRPTAFSCSC